MQFNFAQFTQGMIPDVEVLAEMREILTFGGNSCADWIMDANFPNAGRRALAPGYYFNFLLSIEARGAPWMAELCQSLGDAMTPEEKAQCSTANLKASARAGFYVSTAGVGFGVEFEVDGVTGELNGFGFQCHVAFGRNFGLWCKFGYSPPIMLEPSGQSKDEYMITDPNCTGGPTECVRGATNMTFAQANRDASSRRRRLREERPKQYSDEGLEILKPLSVAQHKRANELLHLL